MSPSLHHRWYFLPQLQLRFNGIFCFHYFFSSIRIRRNNRVSNHVNRISLTLKSVIISRDSYLHQKLNSNIKNKILFHANTTGISAGKKILRNRNFFHRESSKKRTQTKVLKGRHIPLWKGLRNTNYNASKGLKICSEFYYFRNRWTYKRWKLM